MLDGRACATPETEHRIERPAITKRGVLHLRPAIIGTRSFQSQESDISELSVKCGCGRTMASVPRHGADAFRCGCGSFVRISQHADTSSYLRCVARAESGPCGRPVVKHEDIDWLCSTHHEQLLHHAFLLLERDDGELDLRRNRHYAQLYKQIDPSWDLSITDTAALLDGHDAVRHDTTLDWTQWLRRRGDVESVVYFVEHGGEIKIGTSVNVKSRIQGLSLSIDSLLATEPGSVEREKALHDQFAEHRLHGEWFRPAPELLAYIDTLPDRIRSFRVGSDH